MGIFDKVIGLVVETDTPKSVEPTQQFYPNPGFNQETYDKIMSVIEKNHLAHWIFTLDYKCKIC